MNTDEINIEELKQDSDFLDFLKTLEVQMKEESSIAKGYQLLDAKILMGNSEDEINDIFTFLVSTSFDKLGDKLANNLKFDIKNSEDLFTARAIYEHAIQLFSEDDKKGAKELFLALTHTISDKDLSQSMLIHTAIVMAGYSFDDFIDKLVDNNIETIDDTSYFIQNFAQPNDTLMNMLEEYIKEAQDILSKLEGAK
ncbi:conserved hypothetical protein [Sulfurovum sp. enrichment culture clone C5]|uniref:Uncharacterized protein n=1 Tax=Sulfurovum sp. enrichment culture clone C5 TaxID=497650 RepID=A0A0S4XLS2_9BACT|nr:conserved hypothetical protein [Sulfurovum sp. enrichment culture clone C5]